MGDAAVYDLAAVVAERDALRNDLDAALTECKLLTHKVITCGVAASHPDASLAHTGVYKGKWDSPQAEEVRKLRAERDALRAEVMLYRNKMGRIAIALFGEQNNVTDEACIAKAASVVEELADTNVLFQDAITLAQSNKDRLDVALAEVALRTSEVELFRDKLKARCDEVAKLRAACAAKDAALLQAQIDLRMVGDDYPGSSCHQWCHERADAITTARSATAGRNWVDATGAVEAIADHGCIDGSGVLVAANVPYDWAGATVKIVRVKP